MHMQPPSRPVQPTVVVRMLAMLAATALVCSLVTVTTSLPAAAQSRGIWISAGELAELPISGPAWDRLKRTADGSFDSAELTTRNSHNTQVFAAALVAARLDDARYRGRVRDELRKVVAAPIDDGDVLAAARRLGTYAIAADLVDLRSFDPSFSDQFDRWLAAVVRHEFSGGGGGGSIVSVQERRLNNFGTNASASRIAVAAYLGNSAELQRAATVFRGWLGDSGAYSDFSAGDLSWQADRSTPVGVNPRGARILIDGALRNVDGVLPDDQRRGEFTWPPPAENYVWGGMAGAIVAAELLERQGYDAWQWQDRALLRATTWLHDVADFPASGDDTWQPWLINAAYGTRFPATAAGAGKNLGFTDWTHASAQSSTPVDPEPLPEPEPRPEPEPEPRPEPGDDQDLEEEPAPPTTAPSPGSEQVFLAAADATVDLRRSTTNAGTRDELAVKDGNNVLRSYLSFDLSGVSGTHTMVLRLHVSDPSSAGGSVATTSSTWSEKQITWANAPAPGSVLGQIEDAVEGAWVEVSLGEQTVRDGRLSLVLTGGATNTAGYSARETGRAPQLLLR